MPSQFNFQHGQAGLFKKKNIKRNFRALFIYYWAIIYYRRIF